MTHKAHLKQRDPRCDTVTVLRMAKRLASKSADMNEVWPWNLHWPDGWAENHFNHIKPGRFRRVRPVTHAEGSREPASTPIAEGKKYRKRVGRRWVVPFTVEERQRQARRMGVKVWWEDKRRDTTPAMAKASVAAKRRAGGLHVMMTLISMANAPAKLKDFHDAGEHTYAMLHGARAPQWVHEGLEAGWITGTE